MFRSSKSQRVKPVVRMFPRMATARTVPRLSRPANSAAGRVPPAGAGNAREMESARVRARLLRMILDNESARRHGWRPNAS